MTFTKLLRDVGIADRATAHGFRSSFRDWCTEVDNTREVVAEAALAHQVRDKAEAAYRRCDIPRRAPAADGTLGGLLHRNNLNAQNVEWLRRSLESRAARGRVAPQPLFPSLVSRHGG